MGSFTSIGEAGARLFQGGAGCMEAVVGHQEADGSWARCLEAAVGLFEAGRPF